MPTANSPHTFDPAAHGWVAHIDDGFIDHVGPFWTLDLPAGSRYGFQAEPHHANLLGVVQGGMLMTFGDRALGLQAWKAAGVPSVTVQFEMQFVSAARIGEFVELVPELVRRTSSLVFMRGMLVVGTRTIATASGVWKTLSGRTTATSGTAPDPKPAAP